MEQRKKQTDIWREICKTHGIGLYKLFEEAGVNVSTIKNWDKSEPDAFETKRKIDEKIKELIKAKKRKNEK